MPTNNYLLLSIILPIYDVEPYLEKCILSLENQDIPKENYEIICVIDGSPDNAKQIILELQKKFDNIILIEQENKGVSVARNNGIKISNGRYLLFVDPDDSLQKNSLKDLLHYSVSNRLQVTYSPFTTVKIDGNSEKNLFNDVIEKLADGPYLYFATRVNLQIDQDRSVAILYNRNFIEKNKLFFTPDMPFLEDGEFIARVLCLTTQGGIYNKAYYWRLKRPGSATKSDLVKQTIAIKGFLIGATNLKKFRENHILNTKQQELINQSITKYVLLAIRSAINSKSIKNMLLVKHELRKNNLKKLDLEGNLSKFKKMGELYNISIHLFSAYWIKEYLLKKLTVFFNKIV